MNIILFDGNEHQSLLPFTFLRPVAEIRCGILTVSEKWEKHSGSKPSFFTQDYLSEKYPLHLSDNNLVISASILPNNDFVEKVFSLKPGEALLQNNALLAYCTSSKIPDDFMLSIPKEFHCISYDKEVIRIQNIWDIFRHNEQAIALDFELVTKGRKSANPLSSNACKGNVFIEEDAKIENAVLNADGGYIYIGHNAEVMDGSLVRGSLALCEHATLKLGAKIYGPTTIGPHAKVGGEVNNTVIFGFSNKAHDGFLGNAVVGEWCNIGADSNNSNLKNNYEEVKVWNYQQLSFVKTGLQFCGLFMGDHSKCAINTMFNTGTVIGISTNIFGSGFPRTFIPSFMWGGAAGFTEYQLNKAFKTAELAFARRNKQFDDVEKKIFCHVYELTRKYAI